MTILETVETCLSSGITLTILDDGKLSIRGKTTLPIAQQLAALAKQDKRAVLTAVETATLQRGAEVAKPRYCYEIKPGSPLFFSAPDAEAYKRWLWAKMDEHTGDAAVVAELFEIANGYWLDCDVHVDGPFAEVVMAAARYMLNRHKARA